jgi:hypothetical protein
MKGMSKMEEIMHKGVAIYKEKQLGNTVYSVRVNGKTATVLKLREARKFVDNQLAVAADVAALKAAFRNWPADGIVKVGVADKVVA